MPFYPKEICVCRNGDPAQRRIGTRNIRDRIDAAPETGGAADFVHVGDDDADDFRETECRNRQVIAAQPQTRNADNQSRYGCGQCADGDRRSAPGRRSGRTRC